MSKRGSRPWNRKKGIDRFIHSQKSAPNASADKYNPPFVEVDGIKYYSDRFYLQQPEGDSPPKLYTCSCGARQPPPTLDRTRLIDSLDLKAAIVGTYTICPRNLEKAYPKLFGQVPTLILHGHKGLSNRISRRDDAKKESSPKRQRLSDRQVAEHGSPDREDHLEHTALKIKSCSDSLNGLIKEEAAQEDAPPEEAWFSFHPDKEAGTFEIPSKLHLTQVLTTWIPPHSRDLISTTCVGQSIPTNGIKTDKQVIDLQESDTDHAEMTQPLGIDPTTATRRRAKRGVHHPKFMLLFEKSGSLVVVVSTSNLTIQTSVDGIWIQRFSATTPVTKIPTAKILRSEGSDFGYVLADFLLKQSEAAQLGHMLPVEFLQRYLSIRSVEEFRQAFQFHEASVHLIATVPGDFPGRRGATHLGRRSDGQRTFLYGSQRVHDILKRLTAPQDQNTKPWLPAELLSNEDRFLAQPTSLGGFWTAGEMAKLVRRYMGEDGGHRDDDQVLRQMDILWPSQEFIRSISCSIDSSKTKKTSLSTSSGYVQDNLVDELDSGFYFLSSKCFNTIDISCIARLSQYEQSNPTQTPSLRCPHFKSYARLFEGNEYELRRAHGVSKASEIFSWFLMSSACLSRGAQGVSIHNNRTVDSDEAAYSNFELGVMFCSRLQGDAERDRVYCWRPSQCVCSRLDMGKNKLIHLPIPYDLRPDPYQPDPEEAIMRNTPYFHEITSESACTGLMTLTPFGRECAASQTSGTIMAPIIRVAKSGIDW